MKIIILHGDNVVESYSRLQKFIDVAQEREWSIVRISDSSQNIAEALVSDSLFEKDRLIVVESANLIDKKTSKWIKNKADDINTNLVIYHQNSVTKTFINSLPKPDKIEEFKLPKLIWSFLDSFYPGNAKNTLLLLHEIIKKEPIEFVFSLLAKQMRDLYWAKVDAKTMTYPSWRIGKLRHQSQKFSEERLIEIIKDLAIFDVKSKTSDSKLIDLLDFIIATKLE